MGGKMTLKTLKTLTKLIPVLIGLLIVLFFLLKSYIIVEPGEKAIIFNRVTGELRVTSREGMFFLIPFIESVTVYDTKVQTYNLTKSPIEGEIRGEDSLQALTSDGQRVFVDLSVRFRLNPEKLTEFHRTIGKNYMQSIIRPQIRNEARFAVSNFSLMEIYTSKRETFQKAMEERLKNIFPKYNIILDSVLVRDVRVSDEFQKVLENKHIAQQEAERMKYVLEKEEKEKERKIIEAQGDAEAIRIKGQALAQNPALIQYEYVQKIAPNVQAIITDGKSIFSITDFLKTRKEK
jgi:regulator of protease activity HflC (stomatin/prohibitin superfamily)